MTTKLSEKEFKKLVIDVAKNISPVLVQKGNDPIMDAENIAIYSKQIANSVNAILAKEES
jgi:hypothetical protein